MSVYIEKIRVANNWVLDFNAPVHDAAIGPLSALAVAEDLDALLDNIIVAPKWVFHITWNHKSRTFMYPMTATLEHDCVEFRKNYAVINNEKVAIRKDGSFMIKYDNWTDSLFNIRDVLKENFDSQFYLCKIKTDDDEPYFTKPNGEDYYLDWGYED